MTPLEVLSDEAFGRWLESLALKDASQLREIKLYDLTPEQDNKLGAWLSSQWKRTQKRCRGGQPSKRLADALRLVEDILENESDATVTSAIARAAERYGYEDESLWKARQRRNRKLKEGGHG
jgi:hypothetical protein